MNVVWHGGTIYNGCSYVNLLYESTGPPQDLLLGCQFLVFSHMLRGRESVNCAKVAHTMLQCVAHPDTSRMLPSRPGMLPLKDHSDAEANATAVIMCCGQVHPICTTYMQCYPTADHTGHVQLHAPQALHACGCNAAPSTLPCSTRPPTPTRTLTLPYYALL